LYLNKKREKIQVIKKVTLKKKKEKHGRLPLIMKSKTKQTNLKQT
jgi:hypothetical protein